MALINLLWITEEVIILDYYRTIHLDLPFVEAIKVKVTDLANLSKKQYKVLGFS